jgi:hypothetical protein
MVLGQGFAATPAEGQEAHQLLVRFLPPGFQVQLLPAQFEGVFVAPPPLVLFDKAV